MNTLTVHPYAWERLLALELVTTPYSALALVAVVSLVAVITTVLVALVPLFIVAIVVALMAFTHAFTLSVALTVAQCSFACLVEFLHGEASGGDNFVPTFSGIKLSKDWSNIPLTLPLGDQLGKCIGVINLSEAVALAEPTDDFLMRDAVSLSDAGCAGLLLWCVGFG